MKNALITAADKLRRDLRPLTFPAPVSHTYNPLEYAWETHCQFLEKFGAGPKKVLFLGMNPGPYGMTQTGVPFGEIAAVRDWMGISGDVEKPNPEHPKRPVTGFSCPRSEVSGRRLWGLFAELFGTAENFFKDHFLTNFCPLVWMKESGANLTPDKIPRESLIPVEAHCRAHLQEVIRILQPRILVGVGGFAEKQLKEVALEMGLDCQIGRILHPSPASPAANRDFSGTATKQLREMGILS